MKLILNVDCTGCVINHNIAILTKAISASSSWHGGLFIQTPTAKSLNNFAAQKPDLPDLTRQELLAFLSETESEGYASASGDMVGIL